VFAQQDGDRTDIHMKISTDKDVEDWQFSAIYDYYDTEVFAEMASVSELDDVFNPTWELVFASPDVGTGAAELASKVRGLLDIHSRELADTLVAIAGRESEYSYDN